LSVRRGILGLLVLFCGLIGALPSLAGTLAPGLVRQMDSQRENDVIKVLVVLRDQVDVSQLDQNLRASKADYSLRHETIVGQLQQLARSSQQDLLNTLGANKAAGDILGFTPHWLVNGIVVTGTVAAVRDLAARDDVLRVEADLVPELIAPVFSEIPTTKDAAGVGIAPGVVAIGARRVWDELGFDGTGVLVGIIDSGVDASHPAYGSRWQGNFGPPEQAWLDAAQLGHPTVPVDVQGHGTHVLGIVTGVADGDTIGVAPGAHWIATNGIQAASAIFDNSILASLEFMTDPDGDPTTTDDVPDVVNNSWGVNESFAGYLDCDSRWWDLIDNCEAAGVVLVWAAGNEGPIAGTVRSPADRAANPYNCFSVGSTSNHAPFLISDFSSRGPSGCGGVYAVKPEISAPGDTIYSALPGGGYIIRSGTSMSSPHVSGVVALMRQANPDVDVVTIKDILMNTAIDLGNAGQDNDYGHGRLDAYAAVQAVMSGLGTVSGTVTDGVTGLPIANALVRRDGAENLDYTDATGYYSLTLYAGASTFAASAFGYFDNSVSVTIPDGGTVNGDLVMAPQPTATISGTVRGPDQLPVAGATIMILDTPVPDLLSDASGFYSVDLPRSTGRTFDVRASAPGLGYEIQTVDLVANVTMDFELPELTWEDFESGGFFSYAWQFAGDFPWQIDINEAFEGTFSARSADVSNGQTSQMYLDYFVSADSDLSFWLQVSSEFGFDFLYFLLDGEIAGSWSGEVPWTQFVLTVPKGNHTFGWVYTKDDAISGGSDAAWIDLVEWPLTGVELFPELSVDAVSISPTLNPDSTSTVVLMISNTGGEDLAYSLTAAPLGQKKPVVKALRPDVPPRGDLAKGEKDLVPTAGIVATGSGGPDTFGYTWSDSDDPAGPAYEWVEISTLGSLAGTGDDMSLGAFDLGFPMTFYGQLFDTVRICTNGFLSFTSTSSPYVNPVLPSASLPNNVVAPFWDDLNPSAGGEIYYWADPAADRFVVQYQDVVRYNTTEAETFEVILNSNGSVIFQYREVSDTGHCTVGIENPDGSDGLTVLYNDNSYLHDGLAVQIVPPGFLPWVQVSPLAGIVQPGQSTPVSLVFDATDLDLGTHLALLNIASNDPNLPMMLVPLILTVEVASAAPDSELPRAVQLSGAVPNPFNPQTVIHYALPDRSPVSLRVHDVKGRLVRTLVEQSLPAGAHTSRWDGRDAQGRTVASGTYFVRLVAGAETRVKAMALVR